MSDKLKKFFQKKKADVKFKIAGPGHRLNEDTSANNVPKAGETSRTCRVEPTDEAKQAATAALARFQSKNTSPINTSLAAIKLQVRKEMEAEKINKNKKKDTFTHLKEPCSSGEVPGPLATYGVFFQCPLIGPEVLSEEEWHVKIEEFIKEQMKDDPILQSIFIIQNCNHNRSKVEECINLLVTCANNIIMNKNIEKYQKIRLANKTFKEKVLPIKGAVEFLESIGFVKKKIVVGEQENKETEDFLVFSDECLDKLDLVQSSVENLQSDNRIQLVLDRNIQVLRPSQASSNVSLPEDFFVRSPAELKVEYQKQIKKVEDDKILKTKDMRLREQQKNKPNYKYCFIRIKFPNCLILQGTFGVNEHFSDVLKFVKECLFNEIQPFKLMLFGGRIFGSQDDNKTLSELNLVPTSSLLFTHEPPSNDQEHPYLKDEVVSLVHDTVHIA